jgi:cyclic-di-GMP-binding biofilm dispersal mediator protein
MHTLSGRRALVTGGSRGIGAAIVARLAADGASVAFTWTRAEQAAEQVKAAHGARGFQVDAADRAGVIALAEQLGPLDIAVINAGVGLIGDCLTLDAASVDRLIDVNVRGAWIAAVEAGRYMREDGRIILIGSILADAVHAPGAAAYAMTKAAIQGMTRGLARDFGARRITVNCIQPGATDTDMNPATGPFAAALHGDMAIPRHSTPAEIAGLAAWLAGPEAAMVTGATLTMDGGFLA